MVVYNNYNDNKNSKDNDEKQAKYIKDLANIQDEGLYANGVDYVLDARESGTVHTSIKNQVTGSLTEKTIGSNKPINTKKLPEVPKRKKKKINKKQAPILITHTLDYLLKASQFLNRHGESECLSYVSNILKQPVFTHDVNITQVSYTKPTTYESRTPDIGTIPMITINPSPVYRLLRLLRLCLHFPVSQSSDTQLSPSDTQLSSSDTQLSPSDTQLSSSDTQLSPSDTQLSPSVVPTFPILSSSSHHHIIISLITKHILTSNKHLIRHPKYIKNQICKGCKYVKPDLSFFSINNVSTNININNNNNNKLTNININNNNNKLTNININNNNNNKLTNININNNNNKLTKIFGITKYQNRFIYRCICGKVTNIY
ncbi:hypothetical protein CDIK_0980 [Cucumispora dikerogammari]|nr:hypothetical protein CDIK_0980 [Cucumispora dikerogammari]